MPVLHPWRARAMAVVAVVLGLVTGPAGAASAQNPEEGRLADARARLAEVREELAGARNEMRTEQEALEDSERQVREVIEAVQMAEQAVSRQRRAVEQARADLRVLEGRLLEEQELMGARVAALYRSQRPDPVFTMFDAGDVTEAVQRSTYAGAIGRRDRMAVERLDIAQREVDGQQRVLHEEEASLVRVLEEREALLAEVEQIRDDRALAAEATADLVAQLEAQEAHLASESLELQAMAERAAAEAAAAAAVRQAPAQQLAEARQAEAPAGASPPVPVADETAGDVTVDAGQDGEASTAAPVAPPPPPPAPAPSAGGGFGWPTGGPVTSGFGPRWGRMHEGIDIGAPSGAGVAASKGGTVSHAGAMGGYGNLVLVSHAGGVVTAYAHLSSISVSAGQSVGAGQNIGAVGCTGSCTGPHLHFEIRVNGAPQDPMAYL